MFPNPASVEGQGEGEGGQLRGYYLMDLASIIAALVLDVTPGHRVADFCAAPGMPCPVGTQSHGGASMLGQAYKFWDWNPLIHLGGSGTYTAQRPAARSGSMLGSTVGSFDGFVWLGAVGVW